MSTRTHEGIKRKSSKPLKRACWEGKRRKIQRGSSPTDTSSLASSINSLDPNERGRDSTCPVPVGERLCKLDQLFARVGSEQEHKFGLFTPSISAQSNPSSDGGFIGSAWTPSSAIRPMSNEKSDAQALRPDHVHRTLTALLPSQHDADVIFESSNGWMILDGTYRASRDIYVNRDAQSYALDMQAVTRERPIIVARTLLHLAICISSLPAEFDPSRLAGMRDLDATIWNYVATVTSLVTSSDEQMLTLHGLETLLLLALFHMSSASLRRSWLVVRRGLNLAHLMGFQRIISQPDSDPPIAAMAKAKVIWRNLVDLDRYLGLHLRLPFGAEDYPLPKGAEPHLIHKARINALSREIATMDRNVSPQTYSVVLAIDEKLESCVREMPPGFWEVPNISSTARSPESLAALERLMVQAWHFGMKLLIHLPYMLRAPVESRYEFSKVAALQASRNVLMRWFALRNASMTQACCRFTEIGVFIAAVTLTLDIVIELGTKERCEVQRTKGTDFAMICRLMGEMEKLGRASPREKMAAQSAVVLKKMLTSLDPSKQPARKARLTVPFFGTIDLEFHKLPVRPAFDVDSDVGKMMLATASDQPVPVFSFVSNALWPSMEEASPRDVNWDIVLFDGLEDRDNEGNWVF